MQMTSPHLILVVFLVFSVLITINTSQIHGFTIKLMPIDQVDKSLFPENLMPEEKYERLSEISQARARLLKSTSSSCSLEQKDTIKYEPYTLKPRITTHRTGYFVTTLTVGSHSYAPYLIVDTGSDDTWMQCEECTECIDIKQGNFKRHESRSYRPLPCNDSRCYPTLCKDDDCMYETRYGSKCSLCYSKGEVGLETFSFFKDSRSGVERFPSTAFGCGLENHGLQWGKAGQMNNIAGILGLGTGPRSIVSQYRNETKLRMSYCLPSWNPTIEKYSYLRFGDQARIKGRSRTTRLLPNVSTWYAVNVTGISVAGSRLRISPNVFRMRRNREGGFILDSGCFQTLLVRTAYDAVRSAMAKYFFDRYRWHPKPSQPQDYHLCYGLPRGNFTFPHMTYHFEGADLFLLGRNNFVSVGSVFCLAILPVENGQTSILGAFQQANYRFVLDSKAMTVSFAAEFCGYD